MNELLMTLSQRTTTRAGDPPIFEMRHTYVEAESGFHASCQQLAACLPDFAAQVPQWRETLRSLLRSSDLDPQKVLTQLTSGLAPESEEPWQAL
jgi:hypothetical protein